jgi:hypothetical protein
MRLLDNITANDKLVDAMPLNSINRTVRNI